jgi:hypothetical protein
VTEVRVERVTDISPQDALAEGCEPTSLASARGEFAKAWDAINGKRKGCSWADSPWVWAVTFKVVQP